MIRMTRWSVSIQSSLTPPYGTLLNNIRMATAFFDDDRLRQVYHATKEKPEFAEGLLLALNNANYKWREKVRAQSVKSADEIFEYFGVTWE